MNKENKVPLWHKYSLTITEASDYFNIGERKPTLSRQKQQQEQGFFQ